MNHVPKTASRAEFFSSLLEMDDDEGRFQECLKRIVKQKPNCDKQSD